MPRAERRSRGPAPDLLVAMLLRQLDEAFEARSWHGTNLRGSLRGMTAAEASWRPGPGRHDCWEIAVHAAYWKYAVWRRLTGEERGSFPLKGSNWFTRPGADSSEAAWKADVALLVEQHRRLREAVAALVASDLGVVPKGAKLPNEVLVRGIASHDLYHAGQIQLLKRLRPGR